MFRNGSREGIEGSEPKAEKVKQPGLRSLRFLRETKLRSYVVRPKERRGSRARFGFDVVSAAWCRARRKLRIVDRLHSIACSKVSSDMLVTDLILIPS
jgi:hypothetical protein